MTNSYIADPHQRKLLKKWAPILDYGKKIVNESTKIALAQVLENTRNYYRMKGMLNEAGTYGPRSGISSQELLVTMRRAKASSKVLMLFLMLTHRASMATTTSLTS